ncbi:MAG: UDP-N-acetylglucosamine pyrophosphorylase [Desulfotomaculaceae bacterium]|nr:UDP-N-acetylglucosamine pyrophosphorylase [Desulfotomaculaceae bacterium]
MTNGIKISELFDLKETIAANIFTGCEYPWEVLPKIKSFILELGATLPQNEYDHPADDIWIARTATVYPSSYIHGPCIVGHYAEIRHCAFIRGSAIIGEHAVVGNSTELKNVILFNRVQAPHYNYVGDSILGFKAHMGAGSITSNIKSDKSLVHVLFNKQKIQTEMKKLGALLGDHVEVGCNTVLNPGTIVGRNCIIYPLSLVRGYVPQDSIIKQNNAIVNKCNRGQA